MKAIKKAFEDSMKLMPLYRKKKRLEMRLKVRQIRSYYESISEAELWLPYKSGFRQFRFFLWDDRQERVVVRIIKDNIGNKRTLLKWLRKLAPLHVYYTTSAWLNPQGIGPDPYGRKGNSKFKKKGWKLKTYHNCFLWQELYFDVDYDNADYNEGAKTLARLEAAFDEENSWQTAGEPSESIREAHHIAKKEDLTVVFSGGKGFHLIDTNWSMENYYPSMESYKKSYCDLPNGGKQTFNRETKRELINDIKAQGILIDYEVTPDPRRIIRLPGTVHGKTLRVCKVISWDDLDYAPDGSVIGYTADDPIA